MQKKQKDKKKDRKKIVKTGGKGGKREKRKTKALDYSSQSSSLICCIMCNFLPICNYCALVLNTKRSQTAKKKHLINSTYNHRLEELRSWYSYNLSFLKCLPDIFPCRKRSLTKEQKAKKPSCSLTTPSTIAPEQAVTKIKHNI